MSSETASIDGAALERLIYQVRGVHAARLVHQENRIDEVHVVGTPRRSAKQIIRDIESILYVQGGVRIDHRKISLVQIADSMVQSAPPRIQLIDVAQTTADDTTSVSVTLALRDHQVSGVGSTRPNQHADFPLLAAYATIHALDMLIGPRGQLQLERLQRQPFGALEVYLSHLSLDSDGVIETLLGISVLRDDELVTVAKAVLDGVNRRIERLVIDKSLLAPR
jgi:hypothetical protein